MESTLKNILLFFFTFFVCISTLAQVNSNHVRVKGYTRSDGTYVAPHYRTAPNATNRDNFSTRGNKNPYTGKAGWIDPDNNINTLYASDYSYSPRKSIGANSQREEDNFKDRLYVEDEFGRSSLYLKVIDKRTYGIYNLIDELILYLVINHRGDWRLFDIDGVHIKTIFLSHEY